MKNSKRTVYYSDEINDDFAGIEREPIRVGADFPYIHQSRLWNIAAFVVYRVIMTPFAYLYSKLKFNLRIVGREKLKAARGKGVFLYGNHTLMAGDAFIPNLVTFPRRTYVVVNAANLSGKGTRTWNQMSGAIPLPTELGGMRAFLNVLSLRAEQGHCIHIYPEAHVWPYYTGIRPFGNAAFRYPVRFNCPVFCTTVTFQKKRFGKTPRVTVFVDGPFSVDPTLSTREREEKLRDLVYTTMCERAKNSTYSPVEYVKRIEKGDGI